jgi:hypothetical protein
MPRDSTYYDDNFGFYDIESEEDVEFYHAVQKESVWKNCQRCGAKVKLRPDYGNVRHKKGGREIAPR